MAQCCLARFTVQTQIVKCGSERVSQPMKAQPRLNKLFGLELFCQALQIGLQAVPRIWATLLVHQYLGSFSLGRTQLVAKRPWSPNRNDLPNLALARR